MYLLNIVQFAHSEYMYIFHSAIREKNKQGNKQEGRSSIEISPLLTEGAGRVSKIGQKRILAVGFFKITLDNGQKDFCSNKKPASTGFPSFHIFFFE